MNRERRDYILLSIGLLVAAIVMYLQGEDGWILAITIAISVVGTFGIYWAARRCKKRRDRDDSTGESHQD